MASPLDPAGIRIRGARICGELNLDGITATTSLRLTGCLLEHPLRLRDATMHLLVLEQCVLPGVWADRAKIDTFTIRDCLVTSNDPDGAVRLPSAHVTIDLRLTGTRVENPAGPAVLATSLTVDASMFMDTFCSSGASANGAVCLAGATITGDLVLSGAQLTADTGPAFNGEDLTVKGAMLLDRGARATGAGELAAVRLKTATVSGDLRLGGTKLVNRSGPALAADLLTVHGDVIMTGNGGPDGGFCATGTAGQAAVQLRGATITGRLHLEGATITSQVPAGRTFAGDTADDAALCLLGATVSGDLLLAGAHLTSATGPALLADLLTVKGEAACSAAGGVFRAEGAGDSGVVCLAGANISGQLSFGAASLTSRDGPALVADGATVQGDVFFDGGFTATGGSRLGTLRLRGATMNGRLILDDACITGLRPAGVSVAEAAKYKGAVYLSGATVGHDFLLRRATLTSSAGPALRAEYLTVKGDACRCEEPGDGFHAIGTGEDGAVSLAAATVTGQVSLRGAVVTNESGPALQADSVTILGDMFLDEGFTATGGSPVTDGSGRALAAVQLSAASIGRTLTCLGRASSTQHDAPALNLRFTKVGYLQLSMDFASGTDGTDAAKALSLDGLSYTALPKLFRGRPPEQVPETEQAAKWISLFRSRAPYSAQAYQQLATAYQGQGNDDIARRLLIAQRDDLRKRGGLTRSSKILQWFLKIFISYGYRSVLALFWLAGLFAVTALIAVIFFGPFGLIQPVLPAGAAPPAHPAHCSFTGQLGYAVDVAFPLITISGSSQQQCDVPATHANDAVVIFGWVVRLLSGALVAIYGAGLIGITSRSPGS